jgi:hypothetical protein
MRNSKTSRTKATFQGKNISAIMKIATLNGE